MSENTLTDAAAPAVTTEPDATGKAHAENGTPQRTPLEAIEAALVRAAEAGDNPDKVKGWLDLREQWLEQATSRPRFTLSGVMAVFVILYICVLIGYCVRRWLG